MHHPQRQNVTSSMVGLKNGRMHKNLTQKVVNRPYCSSHECCLHVDIVMMDYMSQHHA